MDVGSTGTRDDGETALAYCLDVHDHDHDEYDVYDDKDSNDNEHDVSNVYDNQDEELEVHYSDPIKNSFAALDDEDNHEPENVITARAREHHHRAREHHPGQ